MKAVVAVFMEMRKHQSIMRLAPPILLICGLAGLVIGLSTQDLFAQEATSTRASTSSDPLFDFSCPDGPDCTANRHPDWVDMQHVPPGVLRQPIDQGGLALPTPTPFASVNTYAQTDGQIEQIGDSGLNAASIDSNNSRGGEGGGTAPIEYRSPASFSQGFDDVTLLPGQNWFFRNNSSPTGSNNWFQGNSQVFTAHAGAANAYIAANFNNTSGTGTISNWMLTPVLTLANGNTFSFWTRTPAGSTWPDRLELRLSTAGASTNVGSTATSVGDFSTLLLSVNSSLVQGGYPETWTRYSVTLAGVPGGATGRFAFRYYVTNGGPNGANSNYIGIDTLEYTGSLANFSCSNVTQIPQNECQALVALYNSTGGPGWTNRDNWLVTNTPCNWYGVSCNSGRVEDIVLGNNQLIGTIPPQLGTLTSLRMLWLMENQLVGGIPAELGSLVRLKSLSLWDNQLSGPIPPSLGGLTSLDDLNLMGNQLSGVVPPELGNLANLLNLVLHENQLSGSIPSQLGNLTNLRNLYLASNQLSGGIPSQLGNLANLQVLWLASNQLSGSIPFQLGSLINLQYLGLSDNQLSGSIPSQLGNLNSLQSLWLFSNQLSGSIPFQLGNLINLQELGLSSNQLSGNIPPQLGNLIELQYLTLSRNQLSGSIPFQLGNLTNLQFLYLTFNQLSGSIPSQLGNLTNLQSLSLWSNQLSGGIPFELGSLISLEALDLDANQLSGSIPSQLGNLTNLQSLYLGANQLSGSIPSQLGNLTNLQYLDLYSNQLSGRIPDQFCNLSSLVQGSVDLGFNKLSDGPACVATVDPDWASTQTVPPSGLQATAQSASQVRLTWTPILYTADGGYYEVGYATNLGGPFAVHGATANKSATSYTATGLSPATTYYFRVRTHTPAHGSQQNNLWSDYSTTVSSTTGPASWSQYLPLVLRRSPPIPDAPALNAITPPGANPSYSITWNPATSATSYLLQRATNASFTDATQVYAGGSTAYTASSQGIARYYYRVQARNQWGNSPWSNVQSVEVRWEREPNNTYDIANGPMNSGLDHYGFPNDASDYFFLQTTRRGQITIDLNNHTGQGLQLLLYYPAGTLVDQDGTEPYRLEYTGDPGRYYVRIYSTGGFNSTTPYTLRAVLP
jgi:Leucine-rich repeat (LRR) protein